MNGPVVLLYEDQAGAWSRYLLLRRLSLPGRRIITIATIAAATVSGIRNILIFRTSPPGLRCESYGCRIPALDRSKTVCPLTVSWSERARRPGAERSDRRRSRARPLAGSPGLPAEPAG